MSNDTKDDRPPHGPLTFMHDGQTYGLEFERVWLPWKHKGWKATKVGEKLPERANTTAYLKVWRDTGEGEERVQGWEEVSHASVRCYFRDTMTKEEGRLRSLKRLTPYVTPALRPKIWEAYHGRLRDR